MGKNSTIDFYSKKTILLLIFAFLQINFAFGQCPPKVTVYSPYPSPGVTYPAASSNLKDVFNVIDPAAISVDYTHSFVFAAMSNFTIKFGDGSPDLSYEGDPITTITHTYTTQGVFVYEIVNNACTGASVKGRIYNGKDKEPQILGAGFPPTDNYCVPNILTFQNNSLGMSPFFEYDWDFGDTPSAAYDTTLNSTNGIGTISHAYSKAYSKCGIYVKFRIRKILPGSNFVPFIQTGGPYNFLNIDVPKVNRQEVILCERGVAQDVELADASVLNCLASGQRTIRWDVVEELPEKTLTRVSGTLGAELTYSVAANKKIRLRVPASATNGDSYKIRLIINNECGRDTSFSVIKVVTPARPSFSFDNSSVCPGSKITFENTSSERGISVYNYIWEVQNDQGAVTYSVQNNNQNVPIPFPLPGKFKVVLKARLSGYSISAPAPVCEATSDAGWVNVNQNVVAQIEIPQSKVCLNSSTTSLITFQLSNNSLHKTSTTRYKWFVTKAGEDTLSFGTTPFSQTKNASFSTALPGRYIFKLEASDVVNACTKTLDLDTVFVLIPPTPLIKAANACVGGEVVLRDSSKVLNHLNKEFPEDFENLKVTIDFRDGSAPLTYLKNDNSPCQAGMNLFNTNRLACTRLTKHIYNKPGKYWVKLTIQNPHEEDYYCALTDSVLVEVYPLPVPSFTKTEDGCAPLKVNLANTTATPSSEIRGYIWNINGIDLKEKPSAGANIDTVFKVAGEYKIILKAVAISGCVAQSAEQKVKVYQVPEFQISSNYSSLSSKCSPLTLAFTGDPGALALNAIEKLIWSFYEQDLWIGGDTILNPTTSAHLKSSRKFENNSFVQKKFKARLTIKLKGGSCERFKETEFVLNPRPKVDFSMDKTEGCSPLSIQFSIDPTNVDPSTQYIWNFAGGSQLTSNNPEPPVITFVNKTSAPVVRTIRLTTNSQQDCNDYIEKKVIVYPESSPKFNIINNKKLCSGESLKFENKSTGSLASQYVWVWGDGTKNDTVSTSEGIIWHKFENNSSLADTTYDVKLLALTDCVSESIVKTVTVERKLRANFNIISNTNCSPSQITLESESEGPVNSFTWKIDGRLVNKKTSTVIQSLSNRTSAPKEYLVTLLIKSLNGCTDSLSKSFIVYPEVVTDFSYKNLSNTACSPAAYTFTNNSKGNANGYVWNFGDGHLDTVYSRSAVEHVFINPSTTQQVFRITLTSLTGNECESSRYADIIVAPSSIPDFSFDSVGCSPFEVKFENRSVKSEILEWDFGNGIIYTGINPPNPIYVNTTGKPITKEIKLKAIASGGCENVVIKKLIVFPQPNPIFSVTPQTQQFPSATVVVHNETVGEDWQYEWNFGDGETSSVRNPGTHQYKQPGSYNITLRAFNDYCSTEFITGVQIFSKNPTAAFKADLTKGCRPLTVTFENLSIDTDSTRYIWEFGDGMGRSQKVDPQYTYYEPGLYSVRLLAVNKEGKTNEIVKEKFIEVTEVPYASFKQSRNVVHIPSEEVYFTNLSENASSYFWDFGDGNYSYEKNPTYTYTDTGTFSITMVAISPNGCSDTTVIEKAVLATADGTIKVPNAFTPSLIGASSRNISSEGLNDVFYPIVTGVEEMEMIIFNRWGEKVYSCKGMKCAWDGYYKGKLCKQDVYIYNIKARLANGEVVEKTGDVMLLN